jgi:hypothetical protein
MIFSTTVKGVLKYFAWNAIACDAILAYIRVKAMTDNAFAIAF